MLLMWKAPLKGASPRFLPLPDCNLPSPLLQLLRQVSSETDELRCR